MILLNVCLRTFKNNKILHNNISHQFLRRRSHLPDLASPFVPGDFRTDENIGLAAQQTIWCQCYKTFFLRWWRRGQISSSVHNWQSLFSQVYHLPVTPGAYPRRKHLKGAPIGLTLALPSNYNTWLERVSKDKPSSLLGLVISDEGKKFYNIGHWCQSYNNTSFLLTDK